jgi:CCR4-NOT transcriptional regulation complex NOT5 subunit
LDTLSTSQSPSSSSTTTTTTFPLEQQHIDAVAHQYHDDKIDSNKLVSPTITTTSTAAAAAAAAAAQDSFMKIDENDETQSEEVNFHDHLRRDIENQS